MISWSSIKGIFKSKPPESTGFKLNDVRNISSRNDSQEALKVRLAKHDEAAKSKPNLPKSPTDSASFSSSNSWTTHSNLSKDDKIGSWDHY